MKSREGRLLHRLQQETRDWCRSVRGDESGLLVLHRHSVQDRPEVWNDD